MIKWSLQKFKLKDLKDYAKNPRQLSTSQYLHLKKSIDRFGIIDKPVCTKEGVLIGGHQRKRVLEESGYSEIDCYVPERDLSEKEIEELNIRLNANHGEFDWEMLANEFAEQDLMEWGIPDFLLSGGSVFDDDEIEQVQKKEKEAKKCPHCGEAI